MGRHHVRNYAALPGAELRAVVDGDLERAESIAAAHGVRAYATVDELLAAQPEVAAASVVTPTSTHREVAGRLLDAGLHVLVEKPIAATVEEGEELTQLAAE